MCILVEEITQLAMNYQPKQDNIDKMKAFIKSIEPNSKGGAKGGAKCASLPFDKLKEQWVEMEKSSDRRDVDFALSLKLGICTGLRSKDLLGLRRFNIHLDSLLGKYYVEGKASKTKKPYKKPISEDLYNSLFDNAVNDEDGLLIHNNGKAYTHGWLSRRIQRAFKKEHEAAKQDGKRRGQRITIGAHSLRKTYGMMLYKEKGINTARIGLQHDSLITTSEYLNVGTEEQIEMEADVFGGLV